MRVNNTIFLLKNNSIKSKTFTLFFISCIFFSYKKINSIEFIKFYFYRWSNPIMETGRFCNLRASSPRYASIVAKIHGWRRKHLPQNVRIFVKCTFEGPCFSFRYYKSSIVKDTIPTWKCSMWSKGRLMKTTKWLGPEI